MLLPIIAISIGSVTATLFGLTAHFWFPLWREKGEGTAHCLLLTNAAMVIAILFKLVQIASDLIDDSYHEQTYSLIVSVLVLMVAIFQFSLSRGYFNYKENEEK